MVLRRSPVSLDAKPARTETRDDWEVVLEFENEGDGPHLIDLSHRARWDVQDRNVSRMTPWGVAVPESPGQCGFENGVLINRMNHTQASVWHLAGVELEPPPEEPGYTNVTDATLLVALLGRGVYSIAEKLTSLDLQDPNKSPPCLLQGPILHVPCQIVSLGGADEGILFTCSWGYGKTMVDGILHAGAEFDLRPAGEDAFTRGLKQLSWFL